MEKIIKQDPSTKKSPAQSSGLLRFVHVYKNSFITVIVLLGIFGLMIYGVCLYKNDILAPAEQLSTMEDALTTQENKLASLKVIKVDLAQMEDSVKQVYMALPYEPDLPDLYLQIVGAVSKNGLTLTSFNTSAVKDDEENKKGIQEVELNLNIFGGDYFALKGFLSDLTNSLRIVDVQSISYAPETQTYAVNLRSYYLLGD